MKLEAPEHVIAETVGEETVLVDLKSNRIFELNRTASRIWTLIGEGCTTEQIRSRLLDEFDVAADEAEAGIGDLVDFLARETLVEEAG